MSLVAYATAAIFCSITSALLTESVVTDPDFPGGSWLTLYTSMTFHLCALVQRLLQGKSFSLQAPLRAHILVSTFSFTGLFCTNLALAHGLDYSTKIIFKSMKLIPTMLFGCRFLNAEISQRNWIAALFLVCSTLSFTYSRGYDDTSHSKLALWLLLASICFDALMSTFQEKLFFRQDIRIPRTEILWVSSGFSVLFSFLTFIFSGTTLESTGSSLVWMALIANTLAYMGAFFILAVMRNSSAVTVEVVKVSKKILTVLFSFYLYQKNFELQHLLGLVLLATSSAVYSGLRVRDTQAGRLLLSKKNAFTVLVLCTVATLAHHATQRPYTKVWLDSKLSYMSTRTFGYSDAANYHRRARMILADLYSQYSNLDSVPLTFADYGSNFGWFSCLLAKELPRSQVFSIEGGIQTDAIEGKGVNFHRAFLQEHGLENNIVCNARFGHETFNVFEASDIRFDVQLLMSVVHWVEKWPAYKGTRTSWEQHVCTWLSAARMSYVEMVNPRGQVREGRDKYHPVWTWYAKREDEKLILVETLQSCGLRAHVHEVLSSSTISHTSVGNAHIRRLHVLQNEEQRRMFRVKLLDTDPTPLTVMKKKLTCEAVLGAIGCAACKDTLTQSSSETLEEWKGSILQSASIEGVLGNEIDFKGLDQRIQNYDTSFDCSKSRSILKLLEAVHSSQSKIECHRGFSKTTFVFGIFGQTMALKVPSASTPAGFCNKSHLHSSDVIVQTKNLNREVALMLHVPHHSLPKLYGHCTETEFSWMLVEGARVSLSEPNASNTLYASNATYSGLIPVVNYFTELYRKGMIMVDIAPKQFSILIRKKKPFVSVVDFDGLKDQHEFSHKLSLLACTGLKRDDCPSLANARFHLHHNSNKFTCLDSRCSVSSLEALMVELLCVHVIYPVISSDVASNFVHKCIESEVSMDEIHTWLFTLAQSEQKNLRKYLTGLSNDT